MLTLLTVTTASRLMESVVAISDRWTNRRSCVGLHCVISGSQSRSACNDHAIASDGRDSIVGDDSMIQSIVAVQQQSHGLHDLKEHELLKNHFQDRLLKTKS